MLEPTVEMYGHHTCSVTDRITLSKFLGEEHFEEVCRPVTEYEVWKIRINHENSDLQQILEER
jgi:hypothetical protein